MASYEFQEWRRVVRACYNPQDSDYFQVGAKGVGMNRRWKRAFENFLEDMGPAPDGSHLAREDEDGDFTPSNCYWAAEDQDDTWILEAA